MPASAGGALLRQGPLVLEGARTLSYATLWGEWAGLLERRAGFRDVLAAYAPILEAWAGWAGPPVVPLRWSAEECAARWERGLPLLADAPPVLAAEPLEELLAPALELLGRAGEESAVLSRFAEAWDRGEVTPAELLPGHGRLGTPAVQALTGLAQESLGFLAYAGLRPVLESYFAECRPHVVGGAWELGVCPLCGAPPGFAELGEDGRRQLACHCCGGSWRFSRLTCPYCGSRDARDLVRLQGEARDEGYLIAACQGCRGYLKEVDRRLRFDTGPALLEDWGSPHLDILARRKEYWRAVPTLVELSGPASGGMP